MSHLSIINARIVTRTEIVDGSLCIEDGTISALGNSPSARAEIIDFAGDYLLPGLVEIHTDNLEKNILPRPGVLWPSLLASALAHDAQIISAGITTVLDALAIGGLREGGLDARILEESIAAINLGQKVGLFKAEHGLHLRCEVSDHQVESHLYTYGTDKLVKLISIMDHTPGQRQWTNLEKWRLYHRDKRWTDEKAEQVRLERLALQEQYAQKNRLLTINFAHEHGIPLASHDDTSIADAEESALAGIKIAEFPTTLAAARVARQRGMAVIMGSPNVVRGSSHSGNLSALELAEQGLLDGLSSDYVPFSLLHAAFILTRQLSIPLPETIATISVNVAELIGLHDRGVIEPGKRADFLQVGIIDDLPIVRKVWRLGRQVY